MEGGRGVKNLDSKLRMVEDGRSGEGGGRGLDMDVHIKFLFLSKKNMNL